MTLKKQGVLPGDGGDESAPSSSSSISSPRSLGRDVQKRPRPPALWNVNECKLWLERHCGDIGVQYADLFHQVGKLPQEFKTNLILNYSIISSLFIYFRIT